MTGPEIKDKVGAALGKIWLKSRPEALSRLAMLETFQSELGQGRTHEESRAVSISAAHRLAGSLGMFGLEEASSCASEIEAMLCQPAVPDGAVLEQLLRRLRKLIEDSPSAVEPAEKRD